ncbi:MAG: hypothetical protein KDA24_08660 [Deltaproteobacteria bacterium]|nr:hypothetical protein [Deltaproteobacteria bacterium]
MSELASLLPELATLRNQDEALARLRAAWQSTSDPAAFSALAQGALAYPGPHPMVPLVLRLASYAPKLDVDVELETLWDRWAQLDLSTRAALAQAASRRVHRDPPWLKRVQERVLERPELGEFLVPLFLAAPFWFAEQAGAIFAAYPHAKSAIAAAGKLLLQRVEDATATAPAHSESRQLLAKLLDYDAREVFDKLDVMLEAAPELGEPLILEMALRSMDLRGVVAVLRERVERDRLKGWLQAAVDDELELLVYLAMV